MSFVLNNKFSKIVMMDSPPEMVKVMEEKVDKSALMHLQPVFFDLEKGYYNENAFDVIYNLLVMHHVCNVDLVIIKFSQMLNPGGLLFIFDLYAEDGSFHGGDFQGHNGFNPEKLADKLRILGFTDISVNQCHSITR